MNLRTASNIQDALISGHEVVGRVVNAEIIIKLAATRQVLRSQTGIKSVYIYGPFLGGGFSEHTVWKNTLREEKL